MSKNLAGILVATVMALVGVGFVVRGLFIEKEVNNTNDQELSDDNVFHGGQELVDGSPYYKEGERGLLYEGEYNPISLRILSPNGGEQFCIGENNIISWQGPSGMGPSVTLEIMSAEGDSYNIGEFEAFKYIEGKMGIGFASWYGRGIGGAQIKPGDAYQMYVFGSYQGEELNDPSDFSFSLQYCQ